MSGGLKMKVYKLLTVPAVLLLICTVADAATTTQLSQYGITWDFNTPVEYGQFVNGDYWVVGPVTITSVSPAWDGQRHGSMVDPATIASQGYRAGLDLTFEAALRATFPVTLGGVSSLVSTIGLPEINPGGAHEGIDVAAVLTVVSAPVPAGTFRPPYVAGPKPLYNVSQVNYGAVPILPLPTGATMPNLTGVMTRVWLDHSGMRGNAGGSLHPSGNMEPYPRDSTQQMSTVAVAMMVDTGSRNEYIHRMIQLGIDLYHCHLNNGDAWRAYGGFGSGRKWPIVFAGIVLGDTSMQNPIATTPACCCLTGTVNKFGEDGHTYYGLPTVEYPDGRPLWGQDCVDGMYEYNKATDNGDRDCRDPNALEQNDGYRICCTSHAWVGETLAARLMNAITIWNHYAFFDYVDWWVNYETQTSVHMYGNDFIEAMWTAYRDTTDAVATPQISPNGGFFLDSIQVTISIATEGADIYYTTDGSGPTTSSAQYTGPFTLIQTTTVKAVAVKSGMSDSRVASAVFTETSGNQIPVADAGADQEVFDNDNNGYELVTLDGSGSYDPDGTIVSYVWKEGITEIGTGVSADVTLDIGQHTITLEVTDNYNVTAADETVVTVSVTTDVTPPTPDPMTWACEPYPKSTTSIIMQATVAVDISGVEYYFECVAGGGHNSGWQDSSIYEDTGLRPAAQYSYEVSARDKSGNHNQTDWSSIKSAVTRSGVGGAPVLVVEEQVGDYYMITACDSSDPNSKYWEVKVDIESGGIFSFKDFTDAGDGMGDHTSYSGTNAYNRQTTLIQFDGRGGEVFSRRDGVDYLADKLTFTAAPDGSSFTIEYEETSETSGYYHGYYEDGAITLNPGDLLTTITLVIRPPDANGTFWDWTAEYENVCGHALSAKIWAVDLVELCLDGAIIKTSDSETTKVDGPWDPTNPQSYMRWTMGGNLATGLMLSREFIVDYQSHLAGHEAGGSVSSSSWAGFDNLRYGAGFDYGSAYALPAGQTRVNTGQVIIDIPGPLCLAEDTPAADFNGDCVVDYLDLDNLTQQWLGIVDPNSEIDLYDDDYIDFKDYSELGASWLEDAS